MSDGQPKKYDTNPLDQDVYERAEAQMGDGAATVDTEGPTRPMHPLDAAPYNTDPNGMQRQTGPYVQHSPLGAETYGRPDSAPAYMPPQAVPYQTGWIAPQPGQVQPLAGFDKFASRGSAHFGLQPNFAAMLCYTPFMGVVASVLLTLYEPPENRFVRYHARQGLYTHIAFWAVAIALSICRAAVPSPVNIMILLTQVFYYFGCVGALVFMMISAYRGQWRKIPIIGDQVHE